MRFYPDIEEKYMFNFDKRKWSLVEISSELPELEEHNGRLSLSICFEIDNNIEVFVLTESEIIDRVSDYDFEYINTPARTLQKWAEYIKTTI